MKKKIIATSVLSLLCCGSIATGATYALFTSDSEISIAVTSGNVEVVAEVTDWEMHSLKDVNMATYEGTEVDRTAEGTFLTGGTATYDDGKVTMSKIVPGDGVSFNIEINNYSNVAIQYRTVISDVTVANADGSSDSLMDALDFTIRDKKYAGVVREEWTYKSETETGVIDTIAVAIDLPVTAGIEWKNKTVSLSISVEAVQGNVIEAPQPWTGEKDDEGLAANTNEEAKTVKIDTAEELASFAAKVNGGNTYEGYTVQLTANIDLDGQALTAMSTFNGSFDGQGYTISNVTGNLFGTVNGTVKNLNVKNVNVLNTSKGGANGFIKTVANGGLVDNCKVSGVDIQWADGISDMTDGFGGVICTVSAGATVQNCEFTDIAVTTYAKTKRTGGVFDGISGTVKDCVFTDVKFNVVSKNGSSAYVSSYGGGLAAVVNGGAVVENCEVNNMQVNVYYGGHLGGIFGKAHISGQTAPITLKDITVNGLTMNVGDTEKSISCVAGFIAQPDSRKNDVRVAIDNCHIYDLDMTLASSKQGESAAAGFISGLCGGVDVTNCSVSGKIDGTNTPANIGGFIGDAGWYGSIEQNFTDCVADVDITVKDSIAGGFIAVDGTLGGGTAILNFTDCKATGTVTVVDGGTGTVDAFCGKTIE